MTGGRVMRRALLALGVAMMVGGCADDGSSSDADAGVVDTGGGGGGGVASLPDMVPVDVGGTIMYVPAGWGVDVDATNGVILMEETPGSDESPGVLVFAGAAGGNDARSLIGIVEGVLADPSVGFSAIATRIEGPIAGGLARESTATYAGAPARIAFVCVVDPASDVYLMGTFAARDADYDRLGGIYLLGAIFGATSTGTAPSNEAPVQTDWSGAAAAGMGDSMNAMWDSMYATWSNNLGDNGYCYGDDSGTCW